LIFFFLAVQLFGGARGSALQPFGMAVLIFAGCLGLFAILQSASGAQRIYGFFETPNSSLFGPYVDRDHFAGLMEMRLPLAILYMAGRHGRRSLEGSVWRVSAVVLALAALLLSGSRAGLLALAAETGVVGALLILATMALFLYLAFRNVSHLFGSNAGWVHLGAALGCCGLLVHSVADFNLHIPANAAWFAVLAGIATSERSGAGVPPAVSIF
jgi:hypothetical protein